MGAHPAPGARPGEVIGAGPDHRWLAYETEERDGLRRLANKEVLR